MFDKSYKAAALMRKSRSLAAVLLAGAMLAGCQSVTATHTTLTDQDYRKRHPILIAEQPEVMDIPVAMKASELTPDINRSINRFVNAYRASGTGFMNIQVPAGSANEVAALTAARAAKNVVQRSGVASSHIRVTPYQVDNKAWVAPVRLSFLKVKAVAPDCGIWPEDLGKPDTVNEILGAQDDVSVIFITAYSKHLLTGLRPEPTFLIEKPFTENQISAILSQILFLHQTSKAPIILPQAAEV